MNALGMAFGYLRACFATWNSVVSSCSRRSPDLSEPRLTLTTKRNRPGTSSAWICARAHFPICPAGSALMISICLSGGGTAALAAGTQACPSKRSTRMCQRGVMEKKGSRSSDDDDDDSN